MGASEKEERDDYTTVQLTHKNGKSQYEGKKNLSPLYAVVQYITLDH
jgi:hypothetical protein